jgi:heat shock protein HslJ
VAAAGWQLFGAAQRHGATEVVLGQSGVDGMCRPLGYQAFVFVDDRYAGSLSPHPMDARTDGAAQIPSLLASDRIAAVFSRYAGSDPLCCPSRLTTVDFRIETGARGPVLILADAHTGPSPSAVASPPPPVAPAPPAASPSGSILEPQPSSSGMCVPEPAATACDPSTASPSTIALRVWHLAAIQFMDDTRLVPDAPARYTLEMGRDGRASVRADCNRAGGAYRLEGSALSFGPLAATRALCPPGSLSDRYLQQLAFVASFVERDGRLYLATRADGAILEFQPAPGLDGVMSGAERCARAGGTVGTASCCRPVGDYPDTCVFGACGCAPDQSHPVQVCRCPPGRCFDGAACVESRSPGGGQLR